MWLMMLNTRQGSNKATEAAVAAFGRRKALSKPRLTSDKVEIRSVLVGFYCIDTNHAHFRKQSDNLFR